MKIRQAFVSNSSSSNFVLGKWFSLEEMISTMEKDSVFSQDAIKNINENRLRKQREITSLRDPDIGLKTLDQLVDHFIQSKINISDDEHEKWESFDIRNNIEYGRTNGVFIGIDREKMGEDETKRQFKTRVFNSIKKVFDLDLDILDLDVQEFGE